MIEVYYVEDDENIALAVQEYLEMKNYRMGIRTKKPKSLENKGISALFFCQAYQKRNIFHVRNSKISVWGKRHKRYLREHKRAIYTTLLTRTDLYIKIMMQHFCICRSADTCYMGE